MAGERKEALDHLVALLEGTVSLEPERSIARGRFEHVDGPVELFLGSASERPYPMNVSPPRRTGPTTENVSGDYDYREFDLVITVGYAYDYDGELARDEEILADEQVILTCLEDPLSWIATDSVSVVDLPGSSIDPVPVPGAGAEADELMMVLSVQVRLTLREAT